MAARSILALSIGDERTASARYRVLAHRPALEAAGFAVRVRFSGDAPAGQRARLWRLVDLLRDVARPAREDLLFIHRKMFPPALAPLLRRRGRPVVLDMDDALDLPPPSRAASARLRRRFAGNFRATSAQADLVLCGNRELAGRLPHARWALLPTPIDEKRFAPGAVRPASGPVVGWVGHSDNLPYLEALAGPLRETARRRPGLRVVVVADRPAGLPGLDVEFRRWSLETEVSCFDGIGVGLMPLADNPWTRGKCAFKAIQYMALGIPTIASPVGMARELVEDGVSGLLAADDAAWVDALDRLLGQPGTAAAIGAAGRRVVERDYALSVVSRRLVGLLTELLAPGSAGRRA